MSEDGFLCKKLIALPLPWQQSQRVFKESERMKVSERKLNKKERERERDSKGQINKLCLRKGRVFVIVRDSLAEGIEWSGGRERR